MRNLKSIFYLDASRKYLSLVWFASLITICCLFAFPLNMLHKLFSSRFLFLAYIVHITGSSAATKTSGSLETSPVSYSIIILYGHHL